MLNQRTPLPRRGSVPIPSADELSATVMKVAGFLQKFPGLPAPSLTIHVDSVMVQFAFLPSEALFPSVARLAKAIGAETQLKPMSDGGWHFETRGRAQGLDVTVFAATSVATDPARVDTVVA
ncbi:hypothetical protein [Streptomyces sp. UNOB3_S3]|uniref:hypothetical protein n=1 Tax=Streptomyces sp. UNOB3_S3 TaxID=2871682 RepID=UPI001E53C5B0|nr:hypothetical protein [Streptomyces sp. UNOB3_S3]MCC3775355.1 hypothetical protein [Streptomyces sp. UNOB3_S3]